MFRRLFLILASVLALTVQATTAHAAPPRPVVTAPKSTSEVLEGDVVQVRARIVGAREAKKATLERLVVPAYFSSPTWESVKTVSVRGRGRISFRVTAQQENGEKFRVRVEMKNGRSKASKAIAVKVWRWIPLREFSPYQETSGTGTGEGSIAGRQYAAWGGYAWSSARSWEGRYTPGRNCRALRGVAGLADTSADATTGSVAVIADEQALWSSPVLTPGAAYPFEVPLNLPYRMALLATNTSAPDLKAFPLIGDPELLCSGM